MTWANRSNGHVLNKPCGLNQEELESIKLHPRPLPYHLEDLLVPCLCGQRDWRGKWEPVLLFPDFRV